MKTAIMGGGLSGLATAAYLAKKGHSVELFEKNQNLGGRAQVMKQDGFTFDMGPSWYMMPTVIEQIFNELGYAPNDFYSLKELSVKYRVFSDDHSPIDLVSSLEENLSNLHQLFPEDTEGLAHILSQTQKAHDLALNLLQKPYHSPVDLLSPASISKGLKLLSLYNPFQSYHSYIRQHISNPQLQKILEFHTVFLGGTPHSTPALYAILLSADFHEKIWFPMGGMGQLVSALVEIGSNYGVTFHTNSEVTALNPSKTSKTLESLQVGKKSYFFDNYIAATDLPHVDLALLPRNAREYSQEYWDSRDYAISTILVYLGVKKRMKSLSHHNFYFQRNWNDHFSTLEKTQLPTNPCFYLSATTKTDHSLAPEGQENLFLLVPVGTHTTTKGMHSYIHEVLRHVEEKIGESFISDINYKKIFTQKDFSSTYNAYHGNALGLAHTLKQSVFLRPRMKSKKLHNLYYAGQFTQPGVGVPTALLSAKYLADSFF